MNNTYKIIKLTEEITERLKNNCKIKNKNIDGLSIPYKRGEFLYVSYYQKNNATVINIPNYENVYNRTYNRNSNPYKNLFIINDDGFRFGDYDTECFELPLVEEIKDMEDTHLVLTFGRESLFDDEMVAALVIINEQLISAN